jgi:1,4-dihydroxy-2-naphthoyl-CoA hydrolase
VGIEVNANHLRSVKEGFVYGAAEAVKLGNRIQVWEIHITDDEGELICVSRLTLLVRKKDG